MIGSRRYRLWRSSTSCSYHCRERLSTRKPRSFLHSSRRAPAEGRPTPGPGLLESAGLPLAPSEKADDREREVRSSSLPGERVSRRVVRRTTGGNAGRERTLPPIDSIVRSIRPEVHRAVLCKAVWVFNRLTSVALSSKARPRGRCNRGIQPSCCASMAIEPFFMPDPKRDDGRYELFRLSGNL